MTDWSQPQPATAPVDQQGHVPFTYVLSAEELAYLEEHGFERSVVAWETRWVKTWRPAGSSTAWTAVINITPSGLTLNTSKGMGIRTRDTYKKYTGMQLLPMMVLAHLAGDL